MWLRIIDAREFLEGSVSVPDSPGVYAWYRRLSLDDTSVQSFLMSISEVLSADSWPTLVEGNGKVGPYRAQIRLQPEGRSLSEPKERIAQVVAGDPSHRSRMTRLVLMASVLQPPLYIGETKKLSSRIAQHLAGQSQFASSMGTNFDRSQLVLTYLEIDRLPDDTRLLLESIVGTAALPRYAGRVG